MQINKLQPNTVYRIKLSTYSYTYMATGAHIITRRIRRQSYTTYTHRMVNEVQLGPVPDVAGAPRSLTSNGRPTEWYSTREVYEEVCSVEEWPSFVARRVQADAKMAEYQAALERAQEDARAAAKAIRPELSRYLGIGEYAARINTEGSMTVSLTVEQAQDLLSSLQRLEDLES